MDKINLTSETLSICYEVKRGQKIQVDFREEIPQIFSFITEDSELWPVSRYDVDKELRNLHRIDLEPLTPFIGVYWFKEGDPTIRLKMGLQGGMLSLTELNLQLQQIDGLTQLANAIDRDLMEVLMPGWTPCEKALIKGTVTVGGGLTGGLVGGGVTALICTALGSNPFGWATLIVGGGVAIVGALVSYFLVNDNIKVTEASQRDAKNRVETIFASYAQIQVAKHALDPPAGTASLSPYRRSELENEISQKAQQLRENLEMWQFVTISNYGRSISFNEQKLREFSANYEESNRAGVLFSIKYLILVVMASLPPDRNNNNHNLKSSIIDRLNDLIVNAPLSASATKTNCYVQLGMLYVSCNELQSAKTCFERVLEDGALEEGSIFRRKVQETIAKINRRLNSQQSAINNNNNNNNR
jgi:hypothetical protein